MTPSTYRFDGFSVDPSRRRVFGPEGEPLPLSSRAYEVLIHLIEHRTEVVSKADLLQVGWPDLVVEENNLGQAISMLRRAFSDSRETSGVIATIPGRGYRFVAPLAVDFGGAHAALSGAGIELPAFDRTVEPPSVPVNHPSLAALPFINLSNDPDEDYFVEGMMQEIVTSLGRIRSLFVIAGSATISLKNHVQNPEEAARHLGVRYILEGSVRRAGSKIRIGVQLTNASSGEQIWAERFEDTLEDVFALQDRVALSIAAAVEPNIAAADLRRIARSPVENLTCYDLYLRASHLRTTTHKAEVIQALEMLDRALELDPEYAPALAQAAGCHSQIYVNRWTEDFEAHRQQGLILAERAERAAGNDAAVLTQVANALVDLNLMRNENLDRAMGLVERAIAINPGSAYAWFISGVLKLMDGGADATEHLLRATRLDPVSPLHEVARVHLGIGRALQGRYEEALAIFRATTYRTPRIQLVVVCVCAQLGQMSQACKELEFYEEISSKPAEAMLDHMSRHTEQQAWLTAMIARVRQSQHRHVS